MSKLFFSLVHRLDWIATRRALTPVLMLPLLLAAVSTGAERTWTEVDGGAWHPSGRVLSKIKARIEPYMRSQEKVFGRKLGKWGTYRFQYQGQEQEGRKFVFINAFCSHYHPLSMELSRTFVVVLDGGSCFFQLEYDPADDYFFGTIINGEA